MQGASRSCSELGLWLLVLFNPFMSWVWQLGRGARQEGSEGSAKPVGFHSGLHHTYPLLSGVSDFPSLQTTCEGVFTQISAVGGKGYRQACLLPSKGHGTRKDPWPGRS